MKPARLVTVKVQATTGRDEVIEFTFDVDRTAPKKQIHDDILQICAVADHRRGQRNFNFLTYQRMLGNLGVEVSEAARGAVDFLYGHHMADFEPDMPQLAPVIQKAMDDAMESYKAAQDALYAQEEGAK